MIVSEILTEATFDVDEVVDLIYNDVYAEYFKNIARYMDGEQLTPSDLKITDRKYTAVELLKRIDNKKIQIAAGKDAITVFTGVSSKGNLYNGRSKTINISFNNELYQMVKSAAVNGQDFEKLMEQIPYKLHVKAREEFSGSKLKGSIAHEFAHWLGDFYHNNHITKMGGKANEYMTSSEKRNKILRRGKPDIYMTDYEIDAMIHDVYQLKRNYGEAKWDSMTVSEMMRAAMTLNSTYQHVKEKGKGDEKQFLKNILKRMNREGLLGKEMKGKIGYL